MGKSKIASIAKVFHNSIYNIILLSEMLLLIWLASWTFNMFLYLFCSTVESTGAVAVIIRPRISWMCLWWWRWAEDGKDGHLGQWKGWKMELMTMTIDDGLVELWTSFVVYFSSATACTYMFAVAVTIRLWISSPWQWRWAEDGTDGRTMARLDIWDDGTGGRWSRWPDSDDDGTKWSRWRPLT